MTDDEDDLESGTQSDIEPPKSSGKQGLKNFATKKGPKLARGKKKNTVTLTNKVVNKPAMGKKV